MEMLEQLTLSEIVIKYPVSANIFEKYRLDFCCGGKKKLADACFENGVALHSVEKELRDLVSSAQKRFAKTECNDMDLDLLMDYIETNHHAYVRNVLPVIQNHLAKVVKAHGERHPEMKEIAELFADVAEEMTLHMHKEEKMLFPFIRQMADMRNGQAFLKAPTFHTVKNPISVMEFEHEHAGRAMEKIRVTSRNYEAPADACTTYRLCLAELDEFERDLHKHVHLENNILFPKAVNLENELINNN